MAKDVAEAPKFAPTEAIVDVTSIEEPPFITRPTGPATPPTIHGFRVTPIGRGAPKTVKCETREDAIRIFNATERTSFGPKQLTIEQI